MIDRRQSWWANLRSHMDTMRELYPCRTGPFKHGYGHIEVPRWVRLVMVYIGGPVAFAEQWWFCVIWYEHRWPQWPGRLAARLTSALDAFSRRYGTAMRYNRPLDPNDPHEVGFWSPSNGDRKRSEARWWIYPSA